MRGSDNPPVHGPIVPDIALSRVENIVGDGPRCGGK